MPVTAFYAALLTPVFLVLSMRVIRARGLAQTVLGDGGSSSLLRPIRAHANFAEYVPLALLLMGLAESLHTSAWLLHIVGVLLIGGRLCHAYSISQQNENLRLRFVGMVLTFTVLATGGAICLVQSIRNGFLP